MANTGSWPKDVGILAMEVYIPMYYVDQTDLEKHDNVSAGKYTIGLGQEQMSFCSDREDVNSLALTVLHNLLDRNNINPADIGRLEVGTETMVDKSKATKTLLMDLFGENTDIEGIDTKNACYGGTSALFNSVNWIESSAWDGRLAIVVCSDIALYSLGPARPTGGAGAIAMLVGPNAPLVIDRGVRASHFAHVYDFYKPDLKTEYPLYDGLLTLKTYLSALDKTYNRYKEKSARVEDVKTINTLSDFDGIIFHCPYSKLVAKSLARLGYNDYLSLPEGERQLSVPQVSTEESFFNKDLEKTFMEATKSNFKCLTEPSLWIAKRVGNMYTASLYGCIAAHLLSKPLEELYGSKLGVFSYGSGCASTFYSISIGDKASYSDKLKTLVDSLVLVKERMNNRMRKSPDEFNSITKLRESVTKEVPFTPVGSTNDFFPGTYYLKEIDQMQRRRYSRVENS